MIQNMRPTCRYERRPYSGGQHHRFVLRNGGEGMIGKENLMRFKKMWTWLSGYPAHNQDYYMEHVASLDEKWLNDCPLANGELKECTGCSVLWESESGSLCTDRDSPLYKYQATSIHYPDYRSFYASQVAVLAMKAIKERGYDEPAAPIFGSDYIRSQLHG